MSSSRPRRKRSGVHAPLASVAPNCKALIRAFAVGCPATLKSKFRSARRRVDDGPSEDLRRVDTFEQCPAPRVAWNIEGVFQAAIAIAPKAQRLSLAGAERLGVFPENRQRIFFLIRSNRRIQRAALEKRFRGNRRASIDTPKLFSPGCDPGEFALFLRGFPSLAQTRGFAHTADRQPRRPPRVRRVR